MNLINMKTKIIVWKFAVWHFLYMQVAMVTVTFVNFRIYLIYYL